MANLVHACVCRDKMSIRRAQAALLEGYAVRQSVGSIWKDLHRYNCRICRA